MEGIDEQYDYKLNDNVAMIKELLISTKQTEASFNIKKESMYVQYDFNVFPTEWDIIYLPNDMIGDYVVDKVEGDNSKIEIVFVNSVGDMVFFHSLQLWF